MRVLHILNTSTFSGAENVVCQIISMFREDDDIQMIYCSRDGNIRDTLAEKNIIFEPVTDMTASELKKVIKKTNPDIIHAHDMKAGYVASKVCGKIPLLSHIHNNAYDSRGISVKAIAYTFAARKAKHIFWVSNSSFEGYAFHSFFRKKSSILYNIISISSLYEKMKQDANTYQYDVVYLGRLTLQKNPHRLLDILKLVVEKRSETRIAIIGTGEMEEEIRLRAEKMELIGNVSFLGFRANPGKILHDSKVMIMTSLWEGTPMVALEAQALGVPIVSTPVDGLKDLVVNDENGFLSDDDNQLADKIIEIVENPAMHDRMSESSISFSKRYNNVENYKRQLLSIYSEVMD